jgi:hypothetical protein
MVAGDPQEARLGLLGWKLVRLIQAHSDQLACGLLERIENYERCHQFVEKDPPEELRQRVHEIYQNMGQWLLSSTESDVERRYTAIGERRASQGVALSQLIFVIICTKEHLWDYVAKRSPTDRAFELFQELELFQLVDRFFDRAAHFAAIGYERYQATHHQAAAG